MKISERNQTIHKIWYNYTVFIRGVKILHHKENLVTNGFPDAYLRQEMQL